MSRIQHLTIQGSVSANVESPSNNGFSRGSLTPLPAGPIKRVRARSILSNVVGNIQAVGMVEFWNNPDSSSETPSTSQIGSFSSATGPGSPTNWTDISATADDHQFAFLGWDTNNTSGTSLSTAEVVTQWDIEFYSSRRVVVLPWRQYMANTTSQVFYPVTDWLPAEDAEKVRAVLELYSAAGNFEVQMGYQITNDKSAPGSATSFGSTVNSDGLNYPSGLASPSVDGKLYIRFGYFVRVTSTGTGLGGVWSNVEMLRD